MSVETMPQRATSEQPERPVEIDPVVASAVEDKIRELKDVRKKDEKEGEKGAAERLANQTLLKLFGEARRQGTDESRLKTWLFAVRAEEEFPYLHKREMAGLQQILYSVENLYPEIDNGYYREWLKRHRPDPDDPVHAHTPDMYAHLWDPD